MSIVKSRLDGSWINAGLYNACAGGHKDLVELSITRGTNDGYCYGVLMIPCESGHRPIVELLIAKGANEWDYALYGACTGRH